MALYIEFSPEVQFCLYNVLTNSMLTSNQSAASLRWILQQLCYSDIDMGKRVCLGYLLGELRYTGFYYIFYFDNEFRNYRYKLDCLNTKVWIGWKC